MARSHLLFRSMAVAAVLVAAPGIWIPTATPASAAIGPCGEASSLPGPGHYVGGMKATLVRRFNFVTTELAVPLGGNLELQVNEDGSVTGVAAAQGIATPPVLPGFLTVPLGASASISVQLQGKLSEPLSGSTIPGLGEFTASATAPGTTGASTSERALKVNLLGIERNACAALQGSWAIEDLGPDEAGSWELRDAVWGAALDGFSEDLERTIRTQIGALIAGPASAALGMPNGIGPAESAGLINALVSNAAPMPTSGLFALAQQVQASGAPIAQVRCLLDLIQTATAGKLQEYMGGASDPSFASAAKLGYALALAPAIGIQPACPVFGAAQNGLKEMLGGLIGASIAAGGEIEPIALLTREAAFFQFDDVAKMGRDWLLSRGVSI
ncbi:MAG: hypothetical protein ACKVVP_10755 [Chloroflexota bacterium]